jgi:hypothetical protein
MRPPRALLAGSAASLLAALLASQACVQPRDPVEDDAAGGAAGGAGPTTSTASIGGTGGDLSTVSVGGSGAAPPACNQIDAESNDDEANAEVLLEMTDCDSPQGATGTIAGPSDEDWFSYHGTDGICIVRPSVAIGSGDPRIEHCIYLECDGDGATTRTCPSTATEDTSAGGLLGCCSASSPLQFASTNCPGASDDGTVYVRLYAPTASDGDCMDYTFNVEY